MNLWFVLILGCLVGILYLNIMEELKIGKDLEILEMDYVNNQHLQETLRVKQPLIFQMQNGWVLPDSHYFCSFDLAEFASKYGKEKMVVYESWQKETIMNMEKALPLIFGEKEEEGGEGEEGGRRGGGGGVIPCWSENNGLLVEETPLKRYCQSCDSFLAPFGTVDTEYDYWLGHAGATLPVRHHNRHSYFLLVLEGEISVQFALNKALKADYKAEPLNDYVFPEPLVTAKEVESEVHWMEVQVGKGQCLSIPPWWWHETRFLVDSQVVIFMYDNAVNSVLTKIREIRETKVSLMIPSF